MATKTEMLSHLREMLHDVLAAKAAGETYAKLSRAHGYVDGYMRALLEMGAATKGELLAIVAAERESVSGPALGSFEDVADEVAA